MDYDDIDCPILINDGLSVSFLFGDAIFRRSQRRSIISFDRARSLQLNAKPMYNNNGQFIGNYIEPEICLGSRRLKLAFPLLICDEDDCPTEIAFGKDFIDKLELQFNPNSLVEVISSKFCGALPPGNLRHFRVKNFRNMSYETDADDRVILLLDMDCFEVQVFERPEQRGKPRVVANHAGLITAVSYEAKMLGINREATPYVDCARQICPDLIVIDPPKTHGSNQTDDVQLKIASSKIRHAIANVLGVLSPQPICQYSSPDEYYVDLTRYVNKMEETGGGGLLPKISNNLLWKSTFHYDGCLEDEFAKPQPNYVYSRLRQLRWTSNSSELDENERQEVRLLYGSTIASRIINEIRSQTGYQSSVGIASNKRVAKIGSGMHKPGSATILAPSGLHQFSQFVDVKDISGLGGSMGSAIISAFGVNSMLDLRSIRHQKLANCEVNNGQIIGYEKAEKVLNWAYGLCDEGVMPEKCSKSATTSQKYYGTCFTSSDIVHQVKLHCVRMSHRLAFEHRENNRLPTKLKLSIFFMDNRYQANIHCVIQNQSVSWNLVRSGDSLFAGFRSNCDLGRYNWNPNSRVAKIQISADFPSESNDQTVYYALTALAQPAYNPHFSTY